MTLCVLGFNTDCCCWESNNTTACAGSLSCQMSYAKRLMEFMEKSIYNSAFVMAQYGRKSKLSNNL